MKKFNDNARVCFIGDSITAMGDWIAHILDYYVKNLPASKVEMYSCGVSGGSACDGLKFIKDDTFLYNPTDAVLMFGINDIGRGEYSIPETPEIKAKKTSSMASYKNNMTQIAKILKGNNIRIIFCTPTPYDEDLSSETSVAYGCEQALFECSEFVKQLAKEYDGTVVDFYSKMTKINKELKKQDDTLSLQTIDRVHPTDIGYSAMARIFLREQGFNDVEVPTAKTVITGETLLNISEKGKLRLETERIIRNLWTTDMFFTASLWGHSDEEKIAHVKKVIESGKVQGEFFNNITSTYLKYKKNQAELIEKQKLQTTAMYE